MTLAQYLLRAQLVNVIYKSPPNHVNAAGENRFCSSLVMAKNLESLSGKMAKGLQEALHSQHIFRAVMVYVVCLMVSNIAVLSL